MLQRVLVRAYGDEPLERVVWEDAGRTVYLVHPDRIEDVRAGLSGPVGFPRNCVFRFDPGQYRRLKEHWGRGEQIDEAIWEDVTPLGDTVAD